MCQYLPELLNTEASRVCPAVLLSIDDSDAVVCPALWEAVLYTVTTLEKCWDYVSAKKGVLPKLWTVLSEREAEAWRPLSSPMFCLSSAKSPVT
ncbi:unnamed protein product [Staurois parvus]|uniref:E3 ubiquitin-protein ligase listerin n=1 Tax=Staurois parvus TaxID=386267 RepID=A0ABN9E399_9NEOB|nr:unnamed protein product [Staurois parvus]